MSLQDVLFSFLGGLGLFLFGLRFMSDALQTVAGDKMRMILDHGTKSPIRGVFTGTIVTGLIQSSSATTVLTVGLVNAKLLTLRQAIGVIMGANIGTTITAYLIGFNLKDYALPIIAAGALILLFSKNKKAQMVGQAIFGFGTLFFGLTIMGNGMEPLKDLPYFTRLMTSIDNNSLIGVIIGTIFTFIVQSSSATIGVLQELALQGAVTYHQAVPILFGDNIGTTVTALLAALGTSVAARRAALTHFIFNLIGTLIFLPLFLLGIFEKVIIFVTNFIFAPISGSALTWGTLNVKLQIAQTHALFNICNTIIHLPLVALLALIVTKLIPDRVEEQEVKEYRTQFIDKRFLNNPSVALSQAVRETLRMGELAKLAFINAIEYFDTHKEELYRRSIILEDTLDILEREITDYVVLASEKRLSKQNSKRAYIILQSLNDIERIGDHCENIIEQAEYVHENSIVFSEEARDELSAIIKLTGETLEAALKALGNNDTEAARQVYHNEKIIDSMHVEYRRSHIKRLNEGICTGSNGAAFLDVLSNLERISDHCLNIVGYVLGER
ncbi:MAG: Na/Pi cotransporter family protein [Clostridia bacterium]|nr:Na/Pi cotransporter family protein [Clostridia bacterium]